MISKLNADMNLNNRQNQIMLIKKVNSIIDYINNSGGIQLDDSEKFLFELHKDVINEVEEIVEGVNNEVVEEKKGKVKKRKITLNRKKKE